MSDFTIDECCASILGSEIVFVDLKVVMGRRRRRLGEQDMFAMERLASKSNGFRNSILSRHVASAYLAMRYVVYLLAIG
jgi:hypothetical protein